MGSVVLYHEFFMMGRAHKTLIHPDLKLPLILGYGKRVRYHYLIMYFCVYMYIYTRVFLCIYVYILTT
jgi:hypothetical protein